MRNILYEKMRNAAWEIDAVNERMHKQELLPLETDLIYALRPILSKYGNVQVELEYDLQEFDESSVQLFECNDTGVIFQTWFPIRWLEEPNPKQKHKNEAGEYSSEDYYYKAYTDQMERYYSDVVVLLTRDDYYEVYNIIRSILIWEDE